MDSIGEVIVVAVVIAIAVVPALVVWIWGQDSRHVIVVSGVNDDSAAVQMFIRVLNHAERSLNIHDDGDKSEGTIYDHDAVIGAVQNRLERCHSLTIECLFNDQADLKLVRAMRNQKRFVVHYRAGGNSSLYRNGDNRSYVHGRRRNHPVAVGCRVLAVVPQRCGRWSPHLPPSN